MVWRKLPGRLWIWLVWMFKRLYGWTGNKRRRYYVGGRGKASQRVQAGLTFQGDLGGHLQKADVYIL